MIRLYISLLLVTAIAIHTSCKKDRNNNNGSASNKHLPGTLYWNFAGDVGYQQFNSGKYVKRKMGMGVGSSLFDSFDISWDDQNILLTVNLGSWTHDECRFVFRKNTDGLLRENMDDGANIFDFRYIWDDLSYTDAYISPDTKYLAIAAQHFSDHPIAIVDTETGETVSSWTVPGVNFLSYGKPVWAADNTLYFRIGGNLYKCAPSNGYQSAPRVLTLPEGASSVTVNPQGTKMVFRRNKHLWMCNMDGGSLTQLTTCETMDFISYDGENAPVFSPDGKYIAFTGATRRGLPWSDHDYPDGSWAAAVGGSYGYIVVIPADGKLYDLDNANSGAIWLQEPDSDAGIPSSHSLLWR